MDRVRLLAWGLITGYFVARLRPRTRSFVNWRRWVALGRIGRFVAGNWPKDGVPVSRDWAIACRLVI